MGIERENEALYAGLIVGLILGLIGGIIISWIVDIGSCKTLKQELVTKGIAEYNPRTGDWQYKPEFNKINNKE